MSVVRLLLNSSISASDIKAKSHFRIATSSAEVCRREKEVRILLIFSGLVFLILIEVKIVKYSVSKVYSKLEKYANFLGLFLSDLFS